MKIEDVIEGVVQSEPSVMHESNVQIIQHGISTIISIIIIIIICSVSFQNIATHYRLRLFIMLFFSITKDELQEKHKYVL